MVQINMFKVLILATTFAVTVVFTSSKKPDLSLQATKRNDPDYGTTKKFNSNNFNKELSFRLSGECPTWMYRANKSEECICGVDNYHTVKCDQSVGRA